MLALWQSAKNRQLAKAFFGPVEESDNSATRAGSSGNSLPLSSVRPNNKLHTAAVARFVHAALTAELPPGWRTQPDHLQHRE
jgi:hypothetical protein